MLNNFPNIMYRFPNLDTQLIKDYYHKLGFFYDYLGKNKSYFNEYMIKDNETPEDISLNFYRDRKYWFIIMLINDRLDPFFDWILTNDELLAYAEKFVTENPTEVVSYVSQNPNVLTNMSETLGFTVTEYSPTDPTDPDNIFVSYMVDHYYTVLLSENDERRKIFLPDSTMMDRLYNTYIKMSNDF
jgi:hypothetical protein